MYDLSYHKENNEQVIIEFIEQYPFAFLTGCDAENKPVATQVPVFIEKRGGRTLLSGHIMKGTDHHKAFLHNKNVLVVFTGKHSYVSATWYSNPSVASTWNYMSVHAKGTLRFLGDTELEAMLQKTSLHFENHNKQSPTVYDNLPVTFKKKVMKMIVAFEIDVVTLDSVFKLSQDRDSESYQNIIEQLKMQNEDSRVIATEMEKRTQDIFPNN